MMFRPQKFLWAVMFGLILTFGYVSFALADGPGDLDITFKGTGIVTTPIGSSYGVGNSVAIQADGKIVVAGISNISLGYDVAAVARYNQDGSLDTGFNSTGVVTTPLGDTFLDEGPSIAIQPDGKIVVAGTSWGTGFSHIAVIRYNPDGSLDTDFR